MVLKQFYTIFLLVTLLSPMGIIASLASTEEESVCEILEDLNEEESDDTEEESNVEETQLFRLNVFKVEIQFSTNHPVKAFFRERIQLIPIYPVDITTPPPELG